ncbi:HU family DNA-binding protein [Lusitaniella coriacea LEGE 07157]|uniref:HU family DNA-binding protein n=1 Tax=Lusitaniella coriacea LEGE 07157 TaxID=945747 RepID=A0A8J7DZ15_9CYAN|nr:HU family DNA-binding protein [Lusitaniella coriacea]MBE9117912.1 HU family DNA-binding protein [Lusitaniella coriacea LEGE 07157]
MSAPISKKEFIKMLANRMETNEKEASQWLEGTIDTFYNVFHQGRGVTLTGFGGFYLQPKRDSCSFKFNPSQKLRKLLGWSSSHKG